MYQVPAIKIEVTYDMMLQGEFGFWDLWIGDEQNCSHVEYKVEK